MWKREHPHPVWWERTLIAPHTIPVTGSALGMTYTVNNAATSSSYSPNEFLTKILKQ